MSAFGTKLARAYAAVCPVLAEAKSLPYPLTDPCEFDILPLGLGRQDAMQFDQLKFHIQRCRAPHPGVT
jgi:hypothetical protein